MLRFFILLLLLSFSFKSFAQFPLDTISSEKGDIVIFSDNKWKYVVDDDFDGILNEYVNSLLNPDTLVVFPRDWDNNVCYSNDQTHLLSSMKDTLWICVNDENDDEFCIPFDGNITSRYGYRKGRYHQGIDIDVEVGDTIRAAWSGKVRYSRYNHGGFGNLVIIRHYNGLESYYAHLDQLLCAPNQEVKAGDVIGLGGNTGHSHGSHLHFEVRFYDAPINPEEIIDFKNATYKDQNLLVHRHLFAPGAKASEFGAGLTVPHINSSRKYYKVRPGDTLSSIARKNSTTVSRICRLNGIRTTTILKIGRSLRVR